MADAELRRQMDEAQALIDQLQRQTDRDASRVGDYDTARSLRAAPKSN
jgi:hypothetical protein